MRHLSDSEFLSVAIAGDDFCKDQLLNRFETLINENEEKGQLIEESQAVAWAKACFSNHAGEDFHQDIIDQLFEALKMNKPEMKDEIRSVMEQLNDFDMAACNELVSMKVDGVE